MKIPNFVVAALFGSLLAMQAWTLNAIIDLKVKVAQLSTTVVVTPIAVAPFTVAPATPIGKPKL